MKHIKSLVVAALAAGSLASAHADVTYISGSTAFQSVADKALTNYISTRFGSRVSYDNATLGSETHEIFNWGPSAGNATNLIIVHWTGSEGGIQSINAPTNNPATVDFLPTNTPAGLVVATNVSGYPDAHPSHIAFSDTETKVSLFYGKGADGRTYNTPFSATKVAVQGFAFIGGAGWPSTATNVSYEQMQSLYGAGALPLSVITGVNADTNNTVFAVGRNADSGTRVTALAELGIGTKGTVHQFMVIDSNTIYQAPIATNDGYVSPAIGNDGYPSSGTLLAAVKTQLATSTTLDQTAVQYPSAGVAAFHTPGNTVTIGYYGAKSALAASGITVLNYNGVAPSTATVENGQYPFWNYEYIMVSSGNTNTNYKTIATQLKNFIVGLTDTDLGNGNAALGNMLVSRLASGGPLSANFAQ